MRKRFIILICVVIASLIVYQCFPVKQEYVEMNCDFCQAKVSGKWVDQEVTSVWVK